MALLKHSSSKLKKSHKDLEDKGELIDTIKRDNVKLRMVCKAKKRKENENLKN